MFANRFTKFDLIFPIAAATVAAILLGFLWGSSGGKSDRLYVTRTDSGEREEYTLTDDRELVFTGNGYTLHVRISDGGVCVESSDCPGCDCVRTGRITEPGRSIVCIPAGLVFTLGGEEDADAVAG